MGLLLPPPEAYPLIGIRLIKSDDPNQRRQRTLDVDWPSFPRPSENQTTWTIFIFWVFFNNLSVEDYLRYFFLRDFSLDASLNSMLPPVIVSIPDFILNRSDVHQTYPDPSIRGACCPSAVSRSGRRTALSLRPRILTTFARTLPCEPSLRLAPAAFSTTRVSKVLQGYQRIMDMTGCHQGTIIIFLERRVPVKHSKGEVNKVYETDPRTCPKYRGEMRVISFIDQPEVIRKNRPYPNWGADV